MSSLGGRDLSYREGMEEKKKKNYLLAARLFRNCYYYYEYGELPVYYSHLEQYGLDSIDKYEYCKSKLTDEAQRMLEEEEENFHGDWREFIRYNIKKLLEEEDFPSPNRPKEKGRLRRWLDKKVLKK